MEDSSEHLDDRISAPEAEQLLGVSGSMVRHLIYTGRIRPIGKFTGAWILSRKQILALKAERERLGLGR
jgi:predicted site-specific integrase-resolvase